MIFINSMYFHPDNMVRTRFASFDKTRKRDPFKLIFRTGGFYCLMLIQFLSTSTVAAQSVPRDEQYKKRPTNAIAAIARGKVDEAIFNLENFLKDFPNDAESNYCMALAHAVQNHIGDAMPYVEKALEAGMPIERFFAGPRGLTKNLVESNEFSRFAEGRFARLIHGPMLGDVTSTSAKVWVRTHREAKVAIKLSDIYGRPIDRFESGTQKKNDFTSVVEIRELQPATKYRYSVFVDGTLLFEDGTFKTNVREGRPCQFKVGFGGGAGYTPWHERMWDTLAVQSFEAFLLLGDNVYIDYPEVPEAQEYCYYRRQSRPEFRRFSSKVPVYAIWDDHDFTVNDGEGGPEIESPAWKRPVWNVFRNQWVNPYYGGGRAQPGCWFDFSIGDVDFIVLDCRYYREHPKEFDRPSMLGEYQKTWLKEKLKASTATFKVVASSVPWAMNTKPGSDDTWDGFPEEREELFSFIEENTIQGVILISADRHRSDAWKIARANGYDLYDFMSSRLTNIHTHDLMSGSLFGYNKKCSFGTLEFDTTSEDPAVTYSIRSIDNEEIHKLTVYRSQLDFKPDKVKNKKGRK
ncbi:MAG: alkaline phosphatase family protein [Cytophagales bacterium]|nr:alkaline phosphatase family protein [Cytophagales bacterium]